MLSVARKNLLEIIRDPLNIAFGLGFPLGLLLLMTLIQRSIPVSLFELPHLTPGIVVFGHSFLALFAATTLARDRCSALLQRLYTTPLTSLDFIGGYFLPLLPLGLMQGLLCYGAALGLGLNANPSILYALLCSLLSAVFFICLGLMLGSICTDKQASGLCGGLLTNLCALLSGAWFDLSMVGGVMEKIAQALPFYHAVEMGRKLLQGQSAEILPHLVILLAYILVTAAASTLLFLRQMRRH